MLRRRVWTLQRRKLLTSNRAITTLLVSTIKSKFSSSNWPRSYHSKMKKRRRLSRLVTSRCLAALSIQIRSKLPRKCSLQPALSSRWRTRQLRPATTLQKHKTARQEILRIQMRAAVAKTVPSARSWATCSDLQAGRRSILLPRWLACR